MKIILSFLIVSILSSAVMNAQVETNVKEDNSPARAKFAEDILNFSSPNSDDTRIDVFVQVPYTEIQFVKNSDVFAAAYSINISVYDEGQENLVTEKLWNESVRSKDFNQTISKNNYNLSLRSFYLQPGKYFIRSTVEDKESKKSFSNERVFQVRDLSNKPSVSDIMLISKLTTATDSMDVNSQSNKILPNITRNISTQRDGIPFFYEIYTDSSGSVNVSYQIVDSQEEVMFSKDTIQQVEPGKTQIFYTFPKQELGLGNYSIKVMLKENGNTIATVSKPFVSRWIGIPTAIKDLDKAVDQMVYIASGGEIDEIEDAENQAEKVKRYMDFWKKKDPTPDTDENEIFDEYYRRVALANENFSHYVEGWKTDRGMVLIILGVPNNIERHPFEYDSKPYEVWEYYELNRQFVFMDETGFGDYRLVNPLYGDEYRFR